jgi:hypothetical protein
MNWGYTDAGVNDLEARLDKPGQTISKPEIRDLITDLRLLKAEVHRLRLELAEANDLCEHLRDKLEGKAK